MLQNAKLDKAYPSALLDFILNTDESLWSQIFAFITKRRKATQSRELASSLKEIADTYLKNSPSIIKWVAKEHVGIIEASG